MPALFLTLLAAALAMAGGRQARLVAGLSGKLGAGLGLLATCWLAAAASSAFAAWLGTTLALSFGAAAKQMFVAFALGAAGIELALTRSRKAPAEPTRSLGAVALVLLVGQLFDAARFLVLAMAIATGMPMLAATGGALGSGAVLTSAWAMGAEWESRLPLTVVRRAIAALFLLAALWLGLVARGVLG